MGDKTNIRTKTVCLTHSDNTSRPSRRFVCWCVKGCVGSREHPRTNEMYAVTAHDKWRVGVKATRATKKTKGV